MKDYKINFQFFRITCFLVIFLFISIEALSQRFYAVVFDKLPQDYQLLKQF